jgi:hypothetical protein
MLNQTRSGAADASQGVLYKNCGRQRFWSTLALVMALYLFVGY